MVNRAVFFDKDGVLNKLVKRENGLSTAPWSLDEVIFTNSSKESVRVIKSYGFKTFLISNQPDMLDLKMSADTLHDILQLNDTYFGFDAIKVAIKRGEPDYKPNKGMVDILAEKYKIDLSQSFLIGDSWKDVVCGKRAGLTVYYVTNDIEYNPPEEYKDFKPDYITTDVASACIDIAIREKMNETIR